MACLKICCKKKKHKPDDYAELEGYGSDEEEKEFEMADLG